MLPLALLLVLLRVGATTGNAATTAATTAAERTGGSNLRNRSAAATSPAIPLPSGVLFLENFVVVVSGLASSSNSWL